MYHSKPLFSVLIANYNNGSYLIEAVESVKAQTYSNWEIVVVDDFSTDESSKILGDLIAEGVTLRVVNHDQNLGCGSTKDDCVRAAKGEICAFLDPDDALVPTALETIANGFMNEPELAMAYSRFFYCDNNLNVLQVSNWVGKIPSGQTNLHANLVSHFCGFKRLHYLQTEGIQRGLHSAVDKDLYYKLEETGPIAFIDEPLYYYRQSTQGVSQFGNLLKAQANHWKVIMLAYERRKKSGFKNLTTSQLNGIACRFELTRGSRALSDGGGRLAGLKHLLKAIFSWPSSEWRRKVQLLRNIISYS